MGGFERRKEKGEVKQLHYNSRRIKEIILKIMRAAKAKQENKHQKQIKIRLSAIVFQSRKKP